MYELVVKLTCDSDTCTLRYYGEHKHLQHEKATKYFVLVDCERSGHHDQLASTCLVLNLTPLIMIYKPSETPGGTWLIKDLSFILWKEYRPSFSRFTSVIMHLGCWKNRRKVKSLPQLMIYINFYHILKIFPMGYYAGKPIQYCSDICGLSALISYAWVRQHSQTCIYDFYACMDKKMHDLCVLICFSGL